MVRPSGEAVKVIATWLEVSPSAFSAATAPDVNGNVPGSSAPTEKCVVRSKLSVVEPPKSASPVWPVSALPSARPSSSAAIR